MVLEASAGEQFSILSNTRKRGSKIWETIDRVTDGLDPNMVPALPLGVPIMPSIAKMVCKLFRAFRAQFNF